MKYTSYNSRIKQLLLAVLLLLTPFAKGQVKENGVSLPACIRMGLNNNLKLKQAQLETVKSGYQFKEAASAGLPQIKVFGQFDNVVSIPVTMIPGEIIGQPGTILPVKMGTKYNANAGLELTQMIFSQNYFASLQLLKKSYEINDLSFQKNKEELVYSIAQLYFMIQLAKLQVSLLDSNLRVISQVYAITKQNYNSGIIRKNDLDRVSVAQGNLEAEKENLLSVHEQQLNMLKMLLGLPPEEQIVLSDNMEILDSLIIQPDTTFSLHTDLLILNKKKELAYANLQLSRSENSPSLFGYANLGYQAQNDKLNAFDNTKAWYQAAVVGVRLSVPLFDGYKVKNKSKQHKLEIEQASIGQQDLKNELKINFLDVTRKYNAHAITSAKMLANLKLAESIFKVSNDMYKQGISSLTDVLNAQSEFNNARTVWLQSLFQTKLSQLEIMKLNGAIRSLTLTI